MGQYNTAAYFHVFTNAPNGRNGYSYHIREATEDGKPGKAVVLGRGGRDGATIADDVKGLVEEGVSPLRIIVNGRILAE